MTTPLEQEPIANEAVVAWKEAELQNGTFLISLNSTNTRIPSLLAELSVRSPYFEPQLRIPITPNSTLPMLENELSKTYQYNIQNHPYLAMEQWMCRRAHDIIATLNKTELERDIRTSDMETLVGKYRLSSPMLHAEQQLHTVLTPWTNWLPKEEIILHPKSYRYKRPVIRNSEDEERATFTIVSDFIHALELDAQWAFTIIPMDRNWYVDTATLLLGAPKNTFPL